MFKNLIELFSVFLQQESHIANMEYRNYFSLYCVQMETQLIHANLVILHNALMSMTRIEHTGLSEVRKNMDWIWPLEVGSLWC